MIAEFKSKQFISFLFTGGLICFFIWNNYASDIFNKNLFFSFLVLYKIVLFNISFLISIFSLSLIMNNWFSDNRVLNIASISFFYLLAYCYFFVLINHVTFYLIFIYLFFSISIFIIIYCSINKKEKFKEVFNSLKPLGIILFSYTILSTAINYLFFNYEEPCSSASTRFFVYAADNELPLIFLSKFFGFSYHALWDSTNLFERPPLQASATILFLPWLNNNLDGVFKILYSPITQYGDWFIRLNYQIIAMGINSIILYGCYLFICFIKIEKKLKKNIFFIIYFSLFILFNTIYTWPKLLAANFLIMGLILIFFENDKKYRNWVLIGILFTLAILSHGSSFFIIISVLIYLLLKYSKQKIFIFKRLLILGLVFGVLYSPWKNLQKENNVSRNELVKWHLGGTIPNSQELKDKSLILTIIDGYKKLTISQILLNKFENFKKLIVPPSFVTLSFKGLIDGIESTLVFVIFVPLLFLLISLKKFLSNDDLKEKLKPFYYLSTISVFVWCLLMFEETMAYGDSVGSSASTSLIQGSFFIPIFLLLIITIALSCNELLLKLACYITSILFSIIIIMYGNWNNINIILYTIIILDIIVFFNIIKNHLFYQNDI